MPVVPARLLISALLTRLYRRELLFALKGDIRADLNLTSELIDEHPKTYQLWCVSFFPPLISAECCCLGITARFSWST